MYETNGVILFFIYEAHKGKNLYFIIKYIQHIYVYTQNENIYCNYLYNVSIRRKPMPMSKITINCKNVRSRWSLAKAASIVDFQQLPGSSLDLYSLVTSCWYSWSRSWIKNVPADNSKQKWQKRKYKAETQGYIARACEWERERSYSPIGFGTLSRPDSNRRLSMIVLATNYVSWTGKHRVGMYSAEVHPEPQIINQTITPSIFFFRFRFLVSPPTISRFL